MHSHYIKLPDKGHQTDKRIMNDPKYASYFGDCLGALDGTHIEAHVPYEKRIPYRNRKATLSQKILAVVTFDLRYCYVLPGWEGSVHDSQVLTDAVGNHGFIVLENKYFLADAGYSYSDYTMIPYRGVRYHLREQSLAEQKPENSKELFHLRHASLRNVVERILGVDKRRFRILSSAPEYSLQTQVQLVFALTALHNFIRNYPSEDVDYFEEESRAKYATGEDLGMGGNILTTSAQMNQKRDRIANEMWADYVDILSHRGRAV